MLRNYLLTVLRTWFAHKLFTLINICGLTVGLSCTVFIMLFMRDELSYDRWIPDSSNLYRVSTDNKNPGASIFKSAMTPFPVAGAMVDQIPEVVSMTRLAPEQYTVSIGDRQFLETADVVDPQFFQVVKLPLMEGNADNVFSNPESVVISQSISKKYFGTESGNIGKNLTIRAAICSQTNAPCQLETHTLVITGILRDLPHNTQLVADIVIPNTSTADLMTAEAKENWTFGVALSYVKLAQGADPEKVLAKLKDLIDRSMKPGFLPDRMRPSDWLIPHLTRFWDAHLTIDQYHGLTPPGSQATVYGFGVIGALILLLACFNFTNLAIASATLRAREISLRKVMGARRDQIIVQFLGEAVLMALIAFMLTLSLIQPLLPSFGRLLNKPIALHYLTDWSVLLFIATTSVIAGLIGGLYPAIVLSKFRPATALRNGTSQVVSSGRFRAVLVILQFAVSIGLGAAAAVVFTQISYMRHIGLGFRQDNLVVISHLEDMSASTRESFANALRSYPGVVQATLTGADVPLVSKQSGTTRLHLSDSQAVITIKPVFIDPEFASTYGVRVLAGRLLSDAYGGDRLSLPFPSSSNVVINASTARQFGISPEEAIGKTLIGARFPTQAATIVGVIDDIKMKGPQYEAPSAIYYYAPSQFAAVSVRVRPEGFSDTLAFVDKTWSQFAPGLAIERFFLEEAFNKQFDSNDRQGAVLGLFVAIAIFIACLGLFGLAAFTAERRTKEIGLRKTFGAKAHHIVLLLLWQFSIPVLIANAVAWPVAYYYLHGWLNGYANRISLNPLYFIGAGATALAIAWVTVYLHAHRIARANPINALRHE